MGKPDGRHTPPVAPRKSRFRSVQEQAGEALARAGIGPGEVIAAIQEATGAAIDPAHDLDLQEARNVTFHLGLLLIDRDRWEKLHPDRREIHRHVQALLALLPRTIDAAEALTRSEAYDARALLAAIEPFKRDAWPDQRSWWHPHAINIRLPIATMLARHKRPTGWANASASGVRAIERLLALCGVQVTNDAIVAALRRGTDKLFSSCQ